MSGNAPYMKVLDLEQTLAELSEAVEHLQQERDDLEIALTTAIEHGDAIESQLELANRQLMNEVRERRAIEKQLRDLVTTITQKSRDLELVLQTITEHADQIDLHWLDRYIESEHTARQDSLTGLANRRQLDESMEREWTRARRTHQPLALIIADIDHFKEYNDHFGHPAGDACLREIAAAFAALVHREGDLVARYGGEEFVFLLPNTDAEGARQFADHIRDVLSTLAIPHPTSPVAASVTVSVGLAVTIPVDDNDTVLLAEADRLLYRAKQQGRNRIMN